MRVFPFWSPGQFSEYLFPFLTDSQFPSFSGVLFAEKLTYLTHSHGRWYAVRTRDSGRLGVAELYSKGTRVRRLTHYLTRC
jgi:hypothetical protein